MMITSSIANTGTSETIVRLNELMKGTDVSRTRNVPESLVASMIEISNGQISPYRYRESLSRDASERNKRRLYNLFQFHRKNLRKNSYTPFFTLINSLGDQKMADINASVPTDWNLDEHFQ